MATQRGWYFDGVSGAKREVDAYDFANTIELRFVDGSPARRLSTQGARRDRIPGAIAIHFADGTFLELPQADKSWLKTTRKESRQMVLRYAIGIVVAIAAVFLLEKPVSKGLAKSVPENWEKLAGAKLDETAFTASTCGGDGTKNSLTKLVSALGPDVAKRVTKISVIDGPANAFAQFGGYIYVTRGLLKEAESPDEVLGVLAHEMGHVSHRHVLAGYVRESFSSFLWSVSFGDSGLISPETARTILELTHSRADEAEADDFAIEALTRAGYSTEGLLNFFQRMQKSEGAMGEFPAFLSSHPGSSDRIKKLKAVAPPKKKTPSPLSAREWKKLRADCGTQEDDDEKKDDGQGT